MPPIHPDQFASTPAAELLHSVARGHLAIDHRVLHALVDEPERTLPSILEFAARDRSEDRVPTWELLAEIFAVHPVPEAIPFLIEEIRLAPDDVPDVLIEAVARQRARIIEPLLQLHEEVADATEIRFLLAAVRPRDPRVLALLMEELRTDPADGAFHLEIFGDPAAQPILEQLRTEHEGNPDVTRAIDLALDALSEAHKPLAAAPNGPGTGAASSAASESVVRGSSEAHKPLAAARNGPVTGAASSAASESVVRGSSEAHKPLAAAQNGPVTGAASSAASESVVRGSSEAHKPLAAAQNGPVTGAASSAASESVVRGSLDEPGEDDLGPYNIFRFYPNTAEPDLDGLPESERLEFLESPYAPHRLMAVSSWVHQPLSDARRQQMLKIARTDPEEAIRGRAWEALREEADKDQVRKAMLARLGESSVPPVERAHLACVLAYNADEPGVKEAIAAAYEDPRTRAKALEAMWRALDPDFAKFPQLHLDDEDPDVRREAITAVGYLGPANAATRLPKFFEDEDFRAEALYAYALAAPGESTRVGVRQILSRIRELARELDEEEEALVQRGLDMRLEMHGKPAVFFPEEAEAPPAAPAAAKVGRNDPCPCGSGKKYKKCCGA